MGRGNRKRMSRLSQSQPAGCARWSRRDGDAAGGNVVLEECLPFPGAVLYSGGGNGMLPDSAMETGKTVFTDGYHRSSMRMQGIFTYNSGQPLLVTQGGLHRGCGLVFTDSSGQSPLMMQKRLRSIIFARFLEDGSSLMLEADSRHSILTLEGISTKGLFRTHLPQD